MKLPLRIAILECDTLLDKANARYGSLANVYREMLEKAADGLQHSGLSAKEGMIITSYAVHCEDKYPSLEDVDAVCISGSKYCSFDNDAWILKLVEFVKQILQQDRVRLVGVCFGHQIIGRALGARLGQNEAGWEVSVVDVQLTDEGKKIFQKDHLSIFQSHRDIVYDFPGKAGQLGWTAKCRNQGMYERNRLITVQGHPEYTRDIVQEILETRHRLGTYPPGVYEDGIRRLQDHDDGILIGQGFLRFLLAD